MTTIRPRLDDAACRGREDLYLKGNPGRADLDLMGRICGACWDRPECLAYALKHEQSGYWAGHTARQRADLRREYGIDLKPILIGEFARARNTEGGDDGNDNRDGASPADGR